MDNPQDRDVVEYIQVAEAFRKRASDELARQAAVAARVAEGAPKAASALVEAGIVPASRRGEAEAVLLDPVKAHGLVINLARKYASAVAAPAAIGAPVDSAVKQASVDGPSAAAAAEARWSQSMDRLEAMMGR